MRGASVALIVAAVPACLSCGYLLLLTLLSGRLRPPARRPPRLRFDVLVPAHDEERGIEGTVRNLLAMDWPRDRFRVLVVADNCSDATAQRAAAAGAAVLERRDPDRRGKGYALLHGFAHSLAGEADAVVVVDADTVVSPGLLHAFAARLEDGAAAVQADYAVRNPGASWRTRLMAIAFATFHDLRSRGRERLAVSCGLRGNGMCFARTVLREVPHDAFSLVEDVEYGIRLAERGHRVRYAGEAQVYGEMVSSERASRSQRRRWEGGRLELARRHAARLLRLSLLRRDRVLADMAMDLLVPPLSIVAVAVAAGVALSAALNAGSGAVSPALWIWSGCAVALVAYVLRGWQLSRTGARGLRDLCLAPFFVAWKIVLYLRPAERPGEWVRTARDGKTPAE